MPKIETKTLVITLIVLFVIGTFSLILNKFYFDNESKNKAKEKIKIDLIANVHPSLQWTFKPITPKLELTPGEVTEIKYIVKNDGKTSSSGVATFEYYPRELANYITKINCFCYDMQTLRPGEEKKYLLVILIDPKVTKVYKTKKFEKTIMQFTFFSKDEYEKS